MGRPFGVEQPAAGQLSVMFKGKCHRRSTACCVSACSKACATTLGSLFLWLTHRKKLLLRAQRRARRVRKAKEVLSDAEFIDIEQGVEGADEVGRADDTAKMEPAEKPDG